MVRTCKRINQKFLSIYQFCNGDLKKFVLLLRKSVYPYEDMGIWENLMKHHYQIKKLFTANKMKKTSLIKTMHTLKKYEEYLK